jgi:allophanate hydrolase subunit 2
MSTAKKSNPGLWKRIVARIKAGKKGGNSGQWSARKAQLAVLQYKKEGGRYSGEKESSNSLAKWTKEKWGTKSGKPSLETGERYLPESAREALTSKEYAATSRAKRLGMAMGKQFVPQPKSIKEKTAKFR